MAEPRGRIITLWVDNPLLAAIDERAASIDESRSGFVKGVLRRELGTPPPEKPSRP